MRSLNPARPLYPRLQNPIGTVVVPGDRKYNFDMNAVLALFASIRVSRFEFRFSSFKEAFSLLESPFSESLEETEQNGWTVTGDCYSRPGY